VLTKEFILKSLANIVDGETGINIVALGLIYGILIEENKVNITMTLTSPSSSLASTIISDIEEQLKADIAGYDLNINIIFDPPWTPSMMDEKYRARYEH